MKDILNSVRQQVASLNGEHRGLDRIDLIQIGSGVMKEIPAYLGQKGFQRAVIVVDANTYRCAGRTLESLLRQAEIKVHRTMLFPDTKGDVLADEASLLQVILDIQQSYADVVLAVGGGTIHDISRYAACTVGVSFVAVPTAPSVDGFTSKGAPIIVRGKKITIPAIGPSAVFADTAVLIKAPAPLIAAGFGDMLGKYTSLFDWRFGSLVAGEPYMELAAELTRSALQKCVDHVNHIAERSEVGITVLMEALLESGLAMLLFGQSHPASGSEHHMSHFWEMEYIRLGKKQLLHGAKVGVACIEMSKLYHRIRKEGPDKWSYEAAFGSGDKGGAASIYVNWDIIAQEIASIPSEETLRNLMLQLGGPVSPAELGIGYDLLDLSQRESHGVRPHRYTLLRAYNERNREQSGGAPWKSDR